MTLTGHSLACQRSENLIFSEIDFSIEAGNICLVKGPNGSGKTTLLRLLAGFLKVEIGHLIYNDKDITNDREIRAEYFLYLGHQNALKNQLTVEDQILFWQVVSNNEYDFNNDPMEIHSILDKRLYECSEGQRRRIALTRLVIENKKFWLLDEPTVSLDTKNMQLFKDTLRIHCDNGGSAMIATHDSIGIESSAEIHLSLDKSLLKQNDPFI